MKGEKLMVEVVEWSLLRKIEVVLVLVLMVMIGRKGE